MHEAFQNVIGRVRCIKVKNITVLKSHSAKYFQILYGILCHPFVQFFFLKIKFSMLNYWASTTLPSIISLGWFSFFPN